MAKTDREAALILSPEGGTVPTSNWCFFVENEDSKEVRSPSPPWKLMRDTIKVGHGDVGSRRVKTCAGKKQKASDKSKGKADEPSKRPRAILDLNQYVTTHPQRHNIVHFWRPQTILPKRSPIPVLLLQKHT